MGDVYLRTCEKNKRRNRKKAKQALCGKEVLNCYWQMGNVLLWWTLTRWAFNWGITFEVTKQRNKRTL